MPVLSYVHNATWKEAWHRQGDNGGAQDRFLFWVTQNTHLL